MNERFREHVESMPALFQALDSSAPFAVSGAVEHRRKAGVYAFFEKGRPVHVGRTRNLQQRLRSHVRESHLSASLAFKLARRALGKKATYKTKGSRADLMNDPAFYAAFATQLARVKAVEVRFVEVPDPIDQYLLELYAHIVYRLELDEFDSH
jgi:CO/xanthine dehydrogenase Mo-binding subunit